MKEGFDININNKLERVDINNDQIIKQWRGRSNKDKNKTTYIDKTTKHNISILNRLARSGDPNTTFFFYFMSFYSIRFQLYPC